MTHLKMGPSLACQISAYTWVEARPASLAYAPGLVTGTSLTDPGLVTGTSLTVPGLVTGTSLPVPGLVTDTSLPVPGLVTGTSLPVPGLVTGTSLPVPGLVTGTSLPVPGLVLNVCALVPVFTSCSSVTVLSELVSCAVSVTLPSRLVSDAAVPSLSWLVRCFNAPGPVLEAHLDCPATAGLVSDPVPALENPRRRQ